MAQKNTEKRMEILKVSYELLSRTDYEKVALSDIAKRSGINKSLLQYYYPKKIAIMQELLNMLLEISFHYMEKNSGGHDDVMQRISDFNTLFFKAASCDYGLNGFVAASISQPECLDTWIETICAWLRRVCGEDTFSYLQLRTALIFSMGGSMHLFQHKDEIGLDYRFITENHIRVLLKMLDFDQSRIDEICAATKEHMEGIEIQDFLDYCEETIGWFSVDR